MDGNAVVNRSTAAVNIGTVTAASTKDVTYAIAGAAVGDRVHAQPQAANSAGIVSSDSFVSSAGVVTTRFSNPTTANIAAGTAVAYDITLIKATGST